MSIAVVSRLVDRALRIYGLLPAHPGKWRIVDKLAPLARPTWGVRTAVCAGFRLRLDLNGVVPRALYYVGEYERAEIALLKKIVQPGWAVLDVGANIGFHALVCARRAGETGTVYAFEPAPDTFANLAANLSMNKPNCVRPFRLALSDTVGEAAVVYSRKRDPALVRLAEKNAAGGTAVETATLDSWAGRQGLQRLDFVKVDIEGAELKFLRGARATLTRFRPAMLMEYCPEHLARFGASGPELIAELEGLGYAVSMVTKKGPRKITAPPAAVLCNLLATPA